MRESDEQLYSRFLRCGGEDELRELMERYGDSLTLYLDGYIHDLNDAEDLMIEAFAQTVHARPSFTQANTFRAYLYKTGRNLALRFHAGRLRRQTFSLDELDWGAEDGRMPEALERELEAAVAAREEHCVLRRCIAGLEANLREALWLVYFEGMSYAESARVMNVKRKQLDYLLQRAKRLLRAELEKEEITHA